MDAPGVTLAANFLEDLRRAQIAHLRREGYRVELGDKESDTTWVGLAWATAILQRLPRKPRTILWSRELSERADVRPLVKTVARAIRKGLNLNPFLSTRHRTLGLRMEHHNGKAIVRPSGIDLAFAAWGIHHLHLGPPSGKRVARTDDLLFAKFKDDTAYLINCYRHTASEGSSPFSKRELLEVVYRNWPELLGKPMGSASRSGPGPSDEELDGALRAGLTVPIEIDGKMFLVGGGIMTSTHSQDALRMADDAANTAAAWQRAHEARADEIADAVAATTGSRPSAVTLRFVLNGRHAHVVETATGKRVHVDGGRMVVV